MSIKNIFDRFFYLEEEEDYYNEQHQNVPAQSQTAASQYSTEPAAIKARELKHEQDMG